MSKVVRKHSAKVCTVTHEISRLEWDADGKPFTKILQDTEHYVLVGGLWFYNGRLGFLTGDAPDGFWNESIAQIISRTSSGFSKIRGVNVTSFKIYMRHWTSVADDYKDTPF